MNIMENGLGNVPAIVIRAWMVDTRKNMIEYVVFVFRCQAQLMPTKYTGNNEIH